MCRDRKPICLSTGDEDETSYSMPLVYRLTDRSMGSMWKITRHNGMLGLSSQFYFVLQPWSLATYFAKQSSKLNGFRFPLNMGIEL